MPTGFPSDLMDLHLDQLRREEIEKLESVKIVEIEDPTPIVPGVYLTGNVERITDYEKGSPALLIKRVDRLAPDSFAGEQGLIFNVKGKEWGWSPVYTTPEAVIERFKEDVKEHPKALRTGQIEP